MKSAKKLSTFIGLVLLSISMQAQNFNYGVQGGANFSVQSELGAIYDNNDIKTGFSLGVYGNYNFSEKFYIQTEINYDQKGSKTDVFTKSYDYLAIPFLANYNLYGEGSNTWKLDCYAGPYAAFLLNATKSYENSEINDVDLVYNSNDAEFGIQYGFKVKYPINENSLLFNLRFGMGLSSFDKDDSDIKNKYVGLGLGYEF